ncbi:MAG: glycosyltransferase [Phycisphaera sp.]|nr:glycosyltransferase [Phycisphaera sp.]
MPGPVYQVSDGVTKPAPRVVVLICCYNGKKYLDECLGSVLDDPGAAGLKQHLVMVDNASADGSVDFVRERYPEVEVVTLDANHGFAGGNNAGWAHIQERYPDTPYMVLLNQDTRVTPGWSAKLAGYLDTHPGVGAAQSQLLLHDKPDCYNTRGNRSHYLGFGFVTAVGEPVDPSVTQPYDVDYASGAAVMVRTALLREVGLFDEVFFAMLEDTDLSWKLRMAGHAVHTVPGSVVYHKYQPAVPNKRYEYLERNRWVLLLTFYRKRTLLLLLPALLAMELLQWVYAVTHGVFKARCRAVGYFLKPTSWTYLLEKRGAIQSRRKITDSQFLAHHTGRIDFGPLDGVVMRYLVNPVFGAYWSLARRLIFW